MEPRQIFPSITYDGENITKDIAPYLKSLSYTDNLSGQADDLSITLEDRKELWTSDWFPDRGAVLKVKLASMNWDTLASGMQALDIGLFAVDSIDASAPPHEVEIKAVSVPDNNELRGVDRTRSWEKAELKTIANDVATGANMELSYESDENPTLDRVEQTEESDLSFLLKLCEDHGLALKVCNNRIVIFDEADYEKEEPHVTIINPGTVFQKKEGMHYVTAITGYRLHALTRDIYKACHVQCNDTESGSNIEATFTDPNKKEGRTLQVKEQVKSIQEAERLAKKKLREKNHAEWSISIDAMGDFNLLAAMTVNIVGFGGKFDGKYIITSAKHDMGNGYTTSIDLRRCLNGY